MIAPLLAWWPAGGLSYQRKEYTYGRKDFIGCQHRRLSDSHYLLSSDKVPDYHGQVLRQAGCPDTGNPQGTLVSSHINCHFANYKSSSYAGWQSFFVAVHPKKYTQVHPQNFAILGKNLQFPTLASHRVKNWDGVVSCCGVLFQVQTKCRQMALLGVKQKGLRFLGSLDFTVVPKAGLEPARICIRQILSLLRLPIPPLRHFWVV